MNRHLIFLFCLFLFVGAKGQKNYLEAMQQADDAFNNQEYKKAIEKYFAAEAFDPTKKDSVKIKLKLTFDRIELLRVEAEDAKKFAVKEKLKAETANKKAERARIEADSAKDHAIRSGLATQVALDKANKLIEAFFFYEDRFALADGKTQDDLYNKSFYYIDKDGYRVEKLGDWHKAEQFEQSGFAKVQKQEGTNLIDYIIDTFGIPYRAAYNIKTIDSNSIALDLYNQEWDSVPAEILKAKQLQILILSGTYGQVDHIKTLPAGIDLLTNLQNLQLSFCGIDSLPDQMGELKNIVKLNLTFNELTNVPMAVTRLKNLSVLKLGQNKIGTIPVAVEDLKNLTVLDLRNNLLKSLPVQIGSLKNLIRLTLSDNQLTSLPEEIGRLTKLSWLSLSNNKLLRLPVQLGTLKKLKELYLKGNPIPAAEIEKLKKLLPGCAIHI